MHRHGHVFGGHRVALGLRHCLQDDFGFDWVGFVKKCCALARAHGCRQRGILHGFGAQNRVPLEHARPGKEQVGPNVFRRPQKLPGCAPKREHGRKRTRIQSSLGKQLLDLCTRVINGDARQVLCDKVGHE